MPRAYGSDRVQIDDEGLVLLDCRLPKGWIPRIEKTLTQSEFPGSAVEWDGEIYEVLTASTRSNGRTHYELIAWDEKNAMRGLHQYCEASERERALEREQKKKRDAAGTLAYILAPLTGLLPSTVQEEIESDYGVPANVLTFVSAMSFCLAGGTCVFLLMAAKKGLISTTPVTRTLMDVGVALAAEAVVRISVLIGTSKPSGSVLGWIGYVLWSVVMRRPLRPRRSKSATPLAPGVARHLVGDMMTRADASKYEKINVLPTEAPPDVAAMDAWMVREPFAALLPAADQVAFARKYGFDPIVNGRRTAAFVLAVGVAGLGFAIEKISRGAATSATWPSLAAAGYLCIEQLARFERFSRGKPAGSVLGVVLGSWVRKVL